METIAKKKILFVITKSNWGGAQAYVHMLAVAAQERGMQVSVALGGTGLPGATAGRLSELLTGAGIQTIFLESFARDISVLRELRAFSELFSVIRREHPDVLHVTSSKAGGIGALAGRIVGVKQILFTSHGLAYDENRNIFSRALILLATWATIMLAHVTIVISSNTYRRAKSLPFCRRKVILIYNGVAPQTLFAREDARARLVKNGTHDSGIWIGTIAEYTKNKALDSLIMAAELLKQRGIPFHLCLIGTEGEERPLLERLISNNDLSDSVHLLGFVPNGASYLSAFDIFTLVSVKEGLPYVLLEAATAKCAVVATDIPGTTDIISPDTGILVTPRNEIEIADALTELIQNESKRHKLGERLFEEVQTKFSPTAMLGKTLALY